MAITRDTAALVAAQLTLAWATRSGVVEYDPINPTDAQILGMYEKFRGLVAEVDVAAPAYDIRKLL